MSIKVTPTKISDVLIIEPQVFSDDRGFFYESFNQKEFNRILGRETIFVQDNYSRSKKGVLRGLHYQLKHTQGKLISVTRGAVFDVAVDLRKSSSTFGQWVGVELSADNKKQLWIPEGFAHGFVALLEDTNILYKTTDYWDADSEVCINWSDITINISWPMDIKEPKLSKKDSIGLSWAESPKFP